MEIMTVLKSVHVKVIYQILTISVDIKIIGQVCLRGSELKKSYIYVLCLLGVTEQRGFFSLNTTFVNYNKPNMLKHILLLTNRQSRLMAYRQFVCWVRKGQPLGKKYRVTLPACIV
jgi:hypothetical protein